LSQPFSSKINDGGYIACPNIISKEKGSMMQIKLVVMDCDGTLLDKNQQIRPVDREALVELAENNIILATASGRNETETEEVVAQIPTSVHRSLHRIVQNGAAVYVHREEQIYAKHFQPELVTQIDEFGRKMKAPLFISTADRIYIPRKANIFSVIERTTSAPICYDPTIISRVGIDIFPSKICFIGDQEKLKRLLPHLREHFSEKIEASITGPIHLDVMPSGVNKAVGICKLAEYMHLSIKEIAVIGDAGNDIPMFKLAGHSFVMEHAQPDVKQWAKQEVRSIAEAAERILAYNNTVS
jgi:Cof subfamily protein (haloacid dehalogenase superfamily)